MPPKPGRGHDKQSGGSTPPPSEPVSAVTFALDPEQLTVEGNMATVTGLDPNVNYEASSVFTPDGGQAGSPVGSSVDYVTDNNTGERTGTVKWPIRRVLAGGSGDVKTWLRPQGSQVMAPAETGPDGKLLTWTVHFEA